VSEVGVVALRSPGLIALPQGAYVILLDDAHQSDVCHTRSGLDIRALDNQSSQAIDCVLIQRSLVFFPQPSFWEQGDRDDSCRARLGNFRAVNGR
jgi:hypothetical protein